MIRVEKTHLPVAALTHPGMKGKNNEDRFGVTAFRLKTVPAEPVLLAVLSDGIGGHRAGEVASEMAVNIISQYAADSDGMAPLQTLEDAIHTASQAIFEQAQENPEQQGMGATCACAWIAGDRLYTATVGDSRIYLMREGAIHQLSTDHTWIQEALERGLIQPDQVNGHPNAHVIRRYLGSPTPPEVDFRMRVNSQNGSDASPDHTQNQGMRLLPNDILLLCSDGLTDLVNDEEIIASFGKGTLEGAGRELIGLANERGGHDNITLIAIEIPDVRASTAAPVPVTKTRAVSRSLLTGCLAVVVLAILAGGAAGGWLLYSGWNSTTATPTLESTLALPGTGFSATPSRTATVTSTPFFPSQTTPTPPQTPGGIQPTLTPLRLNTPTVPPLPIVTVKP